MITVHCLVKNEENFIWYAVTSVVDHVDQVLLWDTGSTDKTTEIIKELKKNYPIKIITKEIGKVDEKKYSEVRQDMLNETKDGWIFILDGDEIWWEDSIKKVTSFIEEKEGKYESLIVPTYNLIGDIYHYQEKSAGQYKFGNKKGHFALRLINKNIPGLHIINSYGKEGFADKNNVSIQNRDQTKIKFLNAPYIHTTHLERSSLDKSVMQRSQKLKYEIGIPFSKDFYYPESFFRPRPEIVPNVWEVMTSHYKTKATLETPFKKIKRRLS